MNNPPKNNNKKPKINIINDPSGNLKKTLDIKSIENLIKTPLHSCNNKKSSKQNIKLNIENKLDNLLVNEYDEITNNKNNKNEINFNEKRDINDKNDKDLKINKEKNLIMSFEKLLEQIKLKEEELKLIERNNNLNIFSRSLDNKYNTSYGYNNKPRDNSNNSLFLLLKDIDDKFNEFENNNDVNRFSRNNNNSFSGIKGVNNPFTIKGNTNVKNPFLTGDYRRKSSIFDRPPPPGYNRKLMFPPLPPKVTIPPTIPEKNVTIEKEINNLSDLLSLIKEYPLEIGTKYNINMEALHNIKTPLEDLNAMIGMHELKTNIVDQIIYFMQDFHLIRNKSGDFMHTVIYGPPGTGKTEIAKIMGKIFCKMGVLKNNVFKKATRSDLIAGYLGQTAIKTRKMVEECLGGVLFIDEAYALGNTEKRDSFAKECIDTLCECLSDNKEELMVIIAGYEEDLNRCFFAYNQGLNSRFPWRFKTDDYNEKDLNLIFQKKIKDAGWELKDKIKNKWFKEKMDYFKYFGRDMETLFAKTKIAHSRRVFCKPKEEKSKLTKGDLEKGFKMFIDNDEVKKRKQTNERDTILSHLYL